MPQSRTVDTMGSNVRVNVAVIGCGYWGPNLIRNFYNLEETRIRTICDLDANKLKMLKRLYPSVTAVTDFREIVNDKQVHAIAIATPLQTHFRLAKLSLLAGKHVLAEKPMTATSAQAKELIQIAKAKKRILMVDHTFIYTSAVQKMKQMIQHRELGKLCYFDSVRINLGLFQQYANVLWDLATHDFSIMDYLIGKTPLAISAVGSSHIKKDMENIVYVTIKFRDNLIGHIHVNWFAPVKLRLTLLSGYKKMIVYNDMEPTEKIKVYDRGIRYKHSGKDINLSRFQYRVGDVYSPRLDDVEALHSVCKHFIECIQNNTQPFTNGQAGLRVVRLLEAAEKSLKTNGAFVPVRP